MEYMLGFDRTVYPIIMKDTSKHTYDCIIHDIMFGAGKFLSHKLNIPAISSCASFFMEEPPLPSYMLEPGFHPQLDQLLQCLSTAQEEWSLDRLTLTDIFCKKEPLNLIYTSRLFHPMGDSFGEECCFVGPSIEDRKESIDFSLVKVKNRKRIYISLGTLSNQHIEFYRTCLTAFTNQPYQVILSIGNKINISDLGNLPDNFIVRNYVPQLEILKASDIFISHGGLNSVSEALTYGVPVIAIPISNDQPAVAMQVAQLGAGLSLSIDEVSAEILLTSVDQIFSNPLYKQSCLKISTSFKMSGGYRKAADMIQRYL